jgi:pantetheine-phosphate adenylyltransferase
MLSDTIRHALLNRRHTIAKGGPANLSEIKAIYPGTFDPMTNGHLDLIARGARIFDQLVVAILNNSSKNPLFSIPERVEMLSEAVAQFGNVTVATFDGLTVDFARQQQAQAIMRGIRAISDYEYELQMALMNQRLAPELETVFMIPAGKFSFVSSRMIKEIFQLGGAVDGLVPEAVIERLKHRVRNGK